MRHRQDLRNRRGSLFQRQPDMMASRLPRCIPATRHPMFANRLKSPGIRGLLQQRTFSTTPPLYNRDGKPEASKHIGFYKEFGRPISKVFLMAFFTYQAFYWLWVKLEKGEEEREKDKVVSALFAEVEDLRGAK